MLLVFYGENYGRLGSRRREPTVDPTNSPSPFDHFLTRDTYSKITRSRINKYGGHVPPWDI